MKKRTSLALSILTAGLLTAAQAEAATQIRVLWYSDGVEGRVFDELVQRFEAVNPDIDIVVDHVAYPVIREQMPIQLEAGRGPDIVRITELKALSQHWLDLRPHLKDAAYWEANYGPYFDWMRADGSTAIAGVPTQVTLTGPFVNTTLFEQAKVALPGEKATWDDWVAAAAKVAQNQKVPMTLAMDRSGHRFAGPAISMGAKFVGADGLPAVVDDGFKAMAERIVRWHREGVMPKEIWGGVSGTTYKGANEEFSNGQVVMYMSGSWQIPQFAQTVKDNFDWRAVPNPCGPAACTGMPGGAGLVGVKYTKSPKEVAQFLDFFASEPVMREFAERTLFIPAHKGLAEKGLNFRSEDPNVKQALETFVKATAQISPVAGRMQAWRWSGISYAAAITRLSQVVAGELSLEDAYRRIDEDVKQKVAEAKK